MLSNSVNAVKCQYRAKPVREGVETRRQPSRSDEGIVQTTNCKGSENYSGKKISRPKMACRFDSGHSHQNLINNDK